MYYIYPVSFCIYSCICCSSSPSCCCCCCHYYCREGGDFLLSAMVGATCTEVATFSHGNWRWWNGIIKTGIALVHFNTIFGFKFREIRFVKLQFNDILEWFKLAWHVELFFVLFYVDLACWKATPRTKDSWTTIIIEAEINSFLCG